MTSMFRAFLKYQKLNELHERAMLTSPEEVAGPRNLGKRS
jgi:hypothetical protein